MKGVNILFLVTSQEAMGTAGAETGVWLEELSAPFFVFKDAGAQLTIASPQGGAVPLDPRSRSILMATRSVKRFTRDAEAMDFLSGSLLLSEVKAADFDILFLPGGHGGLWDLAGNTSVKKLLEDFYQAGKLIGCVSHGTAALLSLQSQGEWLVKGKNLTAFSNGEEESAGLSPQLPFLIESRLVSLGALYTKAAAYTPHVVTDGNLITGQNPASAEGVAQQIVTLRRMGKYDMPAATVLG